MPTTPNLVGQVLAFLGQAGGLTNGRLYWHKDLLVPFGVPTTKAAELRRKLLRRFPSRATDATFRTSSERERRTLAEQIAKFIEGEISGAASSDLSTMSAADELAKLRSIVVPSNEVGLTFQTDVERRAFLTPLRFWNRFRRALRFLCGASTPTVNESRLWNEWTKTVTLAAHEACSSFGVQFGEGFHTYSKCGGSFKERSIRVSGSQAYLDAALTREDEIWIAFEGEGAPYPRKGNWHEEFCKLSRFPQAVHLRVIQGFFNEQEGYEFRNGGLQSQIESIKQSTATDDAWLLCFGSYDTTGPDANEHWTAFELSSDWTVQPIEDKHPLCLRLVARKDAAHPHIEPD